MLNILYVISFHLHKNPMKSAISIVNVFIDVESHSEPDFNKKNLIY